MAHGKGYDGTESEIPKEGFATAATESIRGIADRLVTEEDNVRACTARLENIMGRAGLYMGEDNDTGQDDPPGPQEIKWVLNGAANRLRMDVGKLNVLLETLENELT
jgi:hypothetical protein